MRGEKGVELLAIVEAEAEADRMLLQANARKEQLIAQAKKDRATRMAAIIPPAVNAPRPKPANAQLQQIKDSARRNRAKAIKAILEELHG